ncbi:PfkB family carbohydrate kinase [Mediterraneibacter massiliensis]|uniref:PfkB family carbohydrate kinase n=1 Tax=Mediterraneibacter massiliensis TaxID=1720300 RepID=UPI0022E56A15|nr:PfkB family carbohydrate kinase [Mediterraneibacter massiliensis]
MNIQEIAKLAGVSVSTVSKVMNGKDKDISEKTRKRVLQIIKDTSYMPYAKYRAKEGLINRFIGLIIEKNNPYYAELIAFVEEALRVRDFYLIVYTIDSSEDEIEKTLNELQKRGVPGVIIDSPKVILSSTEECKLVYLAHTGNFESEQKNTFYYRCYDAGRLAAKTLFEAGHQKISCMLLETEKTILDGVEAVSRERNHRKEFITSYIANSKEEIYQNALEICVGDNATAVICSDAEMAGAIVEYAKKIGLKIPEECSLLCTRDQEVLKYLAGGISAIDYPIHQIAEDAVSHLLKMIIEKQESEIARRFFPELHERNSIWNICAESKTEKIIVIGSMNMDNSIEGTLTPVNGETTIATNILMMPGGKGANQAVGVGRLGGASYMIGKIGKDVDGRRIYKSLIDNSVRTEGVEFDEHASSGKAFVHIDKKGENAIVVYRGANGNLDEAQLRRHEDLFKSAKYCLLSCELSGDILIAAKNICKINGVEIILKPSAIENIGEDFLEGIEYIVPNEKEMERIYPTDDLNLEERAEKLLELGVKNIIVTRGRQGVYLKNKQYSKYFDKNPFTAIDSTGGADAFISAMAVSLSEGRDLIYSIVYASYAAGITVTRYGVQEALPDRKTMHIYHDEIERQYRKEKDGGDGK